MPKYTYSLTNGKTLELEGDVQPSDAEVESIAKQQGVQLVTADTTTKPSESLYDKFKKSMMNMERDMPVLGRNNKGFEEATSILPHLEHPKDEGWPGYLARGAYNTLIEPLGSAAGLMGASPMGMAVREVPLGAKGVFEAVKGAKPFPKLPGQVNPNDIGAMGPSPLYDRFARWRQVPVGTKSSISPQNFKDLDMKINDMVDLGFDYVELDAKGKMVFKKVKESATPEQLLAPDYKQGKALQILNIPRTSMAGMDLSNPLRQGIGLIHRPEFWKSLPEMFKALGSEQAYKNAQEEILSRPIFKKRVMANGKLAPSIAEEAGLKLTDLYGVREESILSNVPEAIPILGRAFRGSNRAYTLFGNKLRADTFEQMLDDFSAYSGINAKNDLPLMKKIATYINDATGRGKLGVGKYHLEGEGGAAKALSTILFSPRLMASRLRMMTKGAAYAFSPETYILSKPSVRREYLRSLFAIGATANTYAQLARMAGAEVETDIASSDFGKPRFGDTRIDPYGGFQQYIVLAQRLLPEMDLSTKGLQEISDKYGGGRDVFGAQMKSTTTGEEYSLWNPGFGRSSQADVGMRFLRSKTNPIINFAWGLFDQRKEISGKEMDLTTLNPMENAIGQRFIPMVIQDIYDLAMSEDETRWPAKALAGTSAFFGMGSQTYGRER